MLSVSIGRTSCVKQRKNSDKTSRMISVVVFLAPVKNFMPSLKDPAALFCLQVEVLI